MVVQNQYDTYCAYDILTRLQEIVQDSWNDTRAYLRSLDDWPMNDGLSAIVPRQVMIGPVDVWALSGEFCITLTPINSVRSDEMITRLFQHVLYIDGIVWFKSNLDPQTIMLRALRYSHLLWMTISRNFRQPDNCLINIDYEGEEWFLAETPKRKERAYCGALRFSVESYRSIGRPV